MNAPKMTTLELINALRDYSRGDWDTLCDLAADELERLSKIINQIDCTADNVPAVGNWTFWWIATHHYFANTMCEKGEIIDMTRRDWENTHEDERPCLEDAYSTRDAAAQARDENEKMR